jgi:3-oxoacyl-(acyl-carrier-protein) synthase III
VIKVNKGSDSAILSVGAYRAPRLVSNEEIVSKIDSSDEWIRQRTGIETRRFADSNVDVIDMAEAASLEAIKRAGITVDQIDTVIFASITYPFQTPSAATGLIARLGNFKAAAMDLGAACAGFTYGVGLASDLVRGGTSKYVLVVGSEKFTDFLNLEDRATAFIFADGAGAVIIGPAPEPGIGPTIWGSDADSRDAIWMNPSWLEFKNNPNAPWPFIAQEGQKVFRWAVFSISKIGNAAIDAAGISPEELKAFIPHQANLRIIETMAKDMKLPESIAIADDIRETGNTSAASIPLAMDTLLKKHPELHGGLALIIGYGAGLVYAGQVVKLPPKPAATSK